MTQITKAMLERYAEHIQQDYNTWRARCGMPRAAMNITFEPGSKYIRVVREDHGQRSSHSFIVAVETPKFPAGTILKSAGWKKPAMNFARGFLPTGTFRNISWTGA